VTWGRANNRRQYREALVVSRNSAAVKSSPLRISKIDPEKRRQLSAMRSGNAAVSDAVVGG